MRQLFTPSRRVSRRWILLILALALCAFPVAAADCADPAERVAALLAGEAVGELPLYASFALDEAALEEDRLRATVTLELPAAVGDLLCVAVLVMGEDEPVTVHSRRLDLASPAGLSYGVEIDLPDSAEQILVVVEDPAAQRFAVAVADQAEGPERPPAGAVRLDASSWVQVTGGASSSARAASPSPPSAAEPVVVRLVPPREQPAAGSTRFAALATSEEVATVVFELDGEPAGRDGVRPFVARIELDRPAREQTVRAVALGRDGALLGSDELVVNRLDVPFRVAIRDLQRDPTVGGYRLEATVVVPGGSRLEQVEIYRGDARGEELVSSSPSPDPSAPFEAILAGLDPGPEEWVRVVARLDDGRSIDAVALLATPGLGEELEVNLVELHVVVTDPSGRVVEGLDRDDFSIRVDGVTRPVEELAFADDVPLVLGLVVDTSGSMQLLMEDTRRAAVKFLGQTLIEGDRAFIVDFDELPRLRQGITPDVVGLMRSLSTLAAQGMTAIYDAIVFSMLQFDDSAATARRALVVLSDGDDRESRMGPKDIIDHGRQLGVPVYVIGLGALDDLRRVYPKAELRRLTAETGGRLWFVDSFAELDAAYATIRDELRNQYTLRFYTDRDLTAEERRSLSVEVKDPEVEVRIVVGGGQGA